MRVLITTNHLRNLAGSEVVTLELIEHFLARDWYVDVYTHDLGEPMLGEIQKLPSWGRLTLHVADLDAEFGEAYDLIWVQHSILPPGLLRRLEAGGVDAPMIWHHLSSFMDVELPRHAGIENQLAALSMGMSSTTVERLKEFGLTAENLEVFDNPAPDAFADAVRDPVSALRRILVVSNHAPAEVREAADALAELGIEVVFLGADDGPVRVTPETLSDVDAVLTIGKTVQYALSMGIPVYLYDHFGGPGWLTDETIAAAAHDSFSGRKEGRQLAAQQLVAEITGGFDTARDFATDRRPEHAERWRLSTRLDALLNDERVVRAGVASLSPEDARQLSSLIALHRDLYRLVLKLQGDIAELTSDARET
ncbi:hypothetical protein M2152_000147 [Microbacteriaceae bacterium SG_E_30_P1]|uniref:Glycosyltransferase subfamily 4-like N-terminal domain-containing protein n=1 Tax=Antiquaquibacter oligotrophicus TaxID=2880260 RepID=A0ABT6KJV1_9MICO|nr:hypothetical protein [Antiquaquibacter oligotrophicus]MDH6179965.1 hypothetical protein [Antiquaquibacter oligotrophicus]UDF14278.1 hypothetical protein LH407_05290 [Antiquaquibacter oligotrophicus]